jgi:hypothetical protein
VLNSQKRRFPARAAHDNLAGVQETNMVFYPGTNDDGYGGLHDCCGSWVCHI